MKMATSGWFKWYPTTYIWVSSRLPFTMDEGLSWFILIHSKGMPTWNSHIGCGVSLELSWWAHFHGRVKTCADWVWYLSKIGELCIIMMTLSWGFFCYTEVKTCGEKLCPNLVVVEKWGLPLNKSNEELNRITGIVTGEYSVVSPTVLTLTLWVS